MSINVQGVPVTQSQAVLMMLRLHADGITPMDALHAVGCMRLAARIRELREAGHHISTTRETRRGITYARYRLER